MTNNGLPQQLMTLSAIAYAAENRALSEIKAAILGELAVSSYATGGSWQLVWGPAQVAETLMYCAEDRTRPGRFVLAIRGTDPLDILNWVQDFWLGLTDYPAPSGRSGGLKITHGTALGLDHLVDMYRGVRPHLFHLWETRAPGPSLHEFLLAQAASRDVELFVTGHSMGGTLASAFAVWLADHLDDLAAPLRVHACTFAAPTAGNREFADYAGARLAESRRYFNVLDIMPLAWHQVEAMMTTPTRLGGVDSWAVPILHAIERDTRNKGYAQPGVAYPLAREAPLEGSGWFHLVGLEHAAATYLSLLDAPPLAARAEGAGAGASSDG